MKGIAEISIIPIRSEKSHSSEMVSQILFGETYSVNDIHDDWVHITTDYDNYSGWISHNQLSFVKNDDNRIVVTDKFKEISNDENIRMIIPSGSMITSVTDDSFMLNGKKYRITSKHSMNNSANDSSSIISNAKSYIGSPYLWGGKSFMGFDCSGFVQTMFKISAIKLPRDASQQTELGDYIKDVEDAQGRDLAFFGDGDKITHVGIIIDNEHIIHCSGHVKVDKIDNTGILSNGIYTHRLKVIKRIIEEKS